MTKELFYTIMLVLNKSNHLPCVKVLESPHMVQVDGGADPSTSTRRHEKVHGFCPPNESIGDTTTINDANVHSHKIVG